MSANDAVDLLVANGILVTVDAGRRILRGSVAVTGMVTSETVALPLTVATFA